MLDAAARGRLDAFVTCMAAQPAQAVYISGTTDAGADLTGFVLASARARAVADYLHEDGLHMEFEVRTYRAGAAGPSHAGRQLGRSATVTTLSPQHSTR